MEALTWDLAQAGSVSWLDPWDVGYPEVGESGRREGSAEAPAQGKGSRNWGRPSKRFGQSTAFWSKIPNHANIRCN